MPEIKDYDGEKIMGKDDYWEYFHRFPHNITNMVVRKYYMS